MSLLSIAIIGLSSGLILGFQPVLISSFTAYLTSMKGRGSSNNRYTLAGFGFIFYLGLFIVFFSTLFSVFLDALTPSYQQAISLIIVAGAILLGLSLIRRYFWVEPVITPPKHLTDALHSKSTKKTGVVNIMSLSLISAYAVLPGIGITIALLAVLGAEIGPGSIVWAAPFVLGLLTPIYVLLAMISGNTKPSAIISWKEQHKAAMRLYNGLTLIFLAWFVLYIIAIGEISW
jgi:MFS family permease